MEEQKETPQISNQKAKKKKVVIIYLSILIALITGALIYMIYVNDGLNLKNQLTQVQLDEAVADLDSMSTELDSRILEIAKLGGEIDTLLEIKNQLEEEKKAFKRRAYKQISELKERVAGYKEVLLSQDKEIARLKKVNEELLTENTDLKSEANELNESIKALNSDREELESKVALASQLKIDGLKVSAVSSSGKERLKSFRNRHIAKLKIEFDILENKVAPIEGKDILVKITAPDGNVIFDVASGSGTFIYEGRESFYTAKKEILFDRNTQTLVYFYNKGSDYSSGKYVVEVFAEDYRMGKGEFMVK